MRGDKKWASWRQTALKEWAGRLQTNGESQVKQVIINLHADNKAVESQVTTATSDVHNPLACFRAADRPSSAAAAPTLGFQLHRSTCLPALIVTVAVAVVVWCTASSSSELVALKSWSPPPAPLVFSTNDNDGGDGYVMSWLRTVNGLLSPCVHRYFCNLSSPFTSFSAHCRVCAH